MRIARLRAAGRLRTQPKHPAKIGPRTRLHAKTRKAQGFAGFDGTPGAVRTHGLQSRSLTLYPAELRAHIQFFIDGLDPIKRPTLRAGIIIGSGQLLQYNN